MDCLAVRPLSREARDAGLGEPYRMAANGVRIDVFCVGVEETESRYVDSGDQGPIDPGVGAPRVNYSL